MPRITLLWVTKRSVSYKILISLLLVSGPTIFADQFAYIKPELAAKAKAALLREKNILLRCDLCGDLQGRYLTVTTLQVVDVRHHGRFEIQVNGQGIDLAYTYVRRGKVWKNLAFELGLAPVGVASEIPLTNPRRPIEEDPAVEKELRD